MKLTVFFLIVLALQVSAKGYTQNVTLSVKDSPLQQVFEQVKIQTGLSFLWDETVLKNTKPVTFTLKNASVKDVMDACVRDQPISYTIIQNMVVIKAGIQNQAITPELFHNIDIKGRVLNEKGEPLVGVSVIEKGSKNGTSTNSDGQYELADVGDNAILVFSFVGYEQIEKKINMQSTINVILKIAIGNLDEVQVIAYGTTTKRKNTGSVGSITAEIIDKQPIANVLAALPGRIPGMLVAQNNGLPGSGIQIQIRGKGSFNQGTIPLYVIDGVPYTNFNGGLPATDDLNSFGTSGANGSISPFGLINPEDIERIDVLKDADATSIYGSRGTNGVVLITTKKGKAGKSKIDFNISSGTTKLNHFIPVLNLRQYLDLRREAFTNDGTTPNVSNAPDLLVWDTTKSTNWQKMFLGGTGHYQDIQATLSGGDSRTRFLFSSNYRRETTLFPGNDLDQRFSNRINIDHSSTDRKFNLSIGASYSSGKTNILTTDLASIYNLPPNLPLYDSTGKLFWSSQFTNPLSYPLRRYKGVTTNLISNANFRYTVLPGLNIQANFGYTITDLDQKTASPASSKNPVNNPTSSAEFADNKAQNWIVEPTAEYKLKISEGKLSVLAGASWQHNISSGYYLSAINYSNEALLGTLSAAGSVSVPYNNIVEYKYAAGFGRINYDWKEKYFININFRRDGSSRFGPNNRFGNFGSVGAAWIFSEEPFLKNKSSFLSFGKLRGSYGTTGNDQITNFQYLRLYNNASPYLGNSAINPGFSLPNQNIQWERTKKLEAALELGFFKDKILLTANYYRHRSDNQILSSALPSQSGFNAYSNNLPAVVQNSGLELELITSNIKSKTFEWKTSFNITFPRNKLVDFPGLATSIYASTYFIGMPITLTRVFHFLGVDPATGKATYEDINKDGIVDFNDRAPAPIGQPYYGGLSNTITYKNFQLDFFFQFNHRFGVINVISAPVGTLRNQNTSILNRWRKPGDTAPFPGASTTGGSPIASSWNFYSSSNGNYGDASYIKLRSASLSYILPAKIISHIKMTYCRFYVEGQNLFTWAKNKYIFDTETTVQGGPSGLGTGTIGQVLPPLRTIAIGINCSF